MWRIPWLVLSLILPVSLAAQPAENDLSQTPVIESVDGTGMDAGNRTGSEPVDGTGMESVDGTGMESVEGTGRESVDGTGMRSVEGTGARSVDGTGMRSVDGTGLRDYSVRPGDTLGIISNKVYGDPSRWKDIFDANRDKLSDPDRIEPGMTLSIP